MVFFLPQLWLNLFSYFSRGALRVSR